MKKVLVSLLGLWLLNGLALDVYARHHKHRHFSRPYYWSYRADHDNSLQQDRYSYRGAENNMAWEIQRNEMLRRDLIRRMRRLQNHGLLSFLLPHRHHYAEIRELEWEIQRLENRLNYLRSLMQQGW